MSVLVLVVESGRAAGPFSLWLRWLRPAEFSTRGGLAEFSRILLRGESQRVHCSFLMGDKVAEFVRIPWRLHRTEAPSPVRLDQAGEWLDPSHSSCRGDARPGAVARERALPAGTADPPAEVLAAGPGAGMVQSFRIGLTPEVGGCARLDHGLAHRGHASRRPGRILTNSATRGKPKSSRFILHGGSSNGIRENSMASPPSWSPFSCTPRPGRRVAGPFSLLRKPRPWRTSIGCSTPVPSTGCRSRHWPEPTSLAASRIW